jgi:DNA-binding MarR family transcriptional regulator
VRRDEPVRATPAHLGFRLAKASQRFNELLHERFAARGHPEVRPAYGSLLIPLWAQDGLRMGELAARARLSKQTMTTMVRLMERDGLLTRRRDPADGRASLVELTPRGRRLRGVADEVLAELDALVASRMGHERAQALSRALQEVMEL